MASLFDPRARDKRRLESQPIASALDDKQQSGDCPAFRATQQPNDGRGGRPARCCFHLPAGLSDRHARVLLRAAVLFTQ